MIKLSYLIIEKCIYLHFLSFCFSLILFISFLFVILLTCFTPNGDISVIPLTKEIYQNISLCSQVGYNTIQGEGGYVILVAADRNNHNSIKHLNFGVSITILTPSDLLYTIVNVLDHSVQFIVSLYLKLISMDNKNMYMQQSLKI